MFKELNEKEKKKKVCVHVCASTQLVLKMLCSLSSLPYIVH